MVPGLPGVLDKAAHSGTEPGCGDCKWTLIIACLYNYPTDPAHQNSCANATMSPLCRPGQTLFRLYLTTRVETNVAVGTLCLGGAQRIVAVGDIAATDVRNYLRDVHPPDLHVRVQPPNGTLAGLPTYFTVWPPANLRPQPFGGGQVRETITIKPERYVWRWGDGSAIEKTDDPGAPYPDGTLTHMFVHGGTVSIAVVTRWTATYTITVAGKTFGPYDATGGPVPHQQSFDLAVRTAHAHLVSGG